MRCQENKQCSINLTPSVTLDLPRVLTGLTTVVFIFFVCVYILIAPPRDMQTIVLLLDHPI